MTSSSKPNRRQKSFTCECETPLRTACTAEPFYKEFERKRYCVLHFPGEGKDAAFEEALQKKIEANDYNFAGVWFPHRLSFTDFTFKSEVVFTQATFNAEVEFNNIVFDKEVSFSGANFNNEFNVEGATFKADTYFVSAIFSDSARFYEITFEANVRFMGASFKGGAFFIDVYFNGIIAFTSAKFEKLSNFIRATFESETIFETAIFHDHVGFTGTKSGVGFSEGASLYLDRMRIEYPEHVNFHTLSLRPHWFVGVDSRKFVFINIEWRGSLSEEIAQLKNNRVSHPHRLLSIACQQLAVNAEENYRYAEASEFRYLSMDARRRENFYGFTFWKLSWWYWLASGYGERALRALIVLASIWLLFSFLYTQVGFAQWEPKLTSVDDLATAKRDEVGAPLSVTRAVTYSLNVMTLQKPEPRPVTVLAQSLVILETIIGPIQVALLALAIRRQFMR